MGKGLPNRDRYIYTYLPAKEFRARWKEEAKKREMSLSRFVFHCVEKEIESSSEHQLVVQGRKSRALAKENAKLREENKMLRVVADKYESELKYYRTKPFLDDMFKGVRAYERELINLLKSRKQASNEEILETLNIDTKDSELVRALRKQLRNLEGYGLVEETVSGWKWKG